ncbi:hypothetical protein [Salarchaeum sp. JOR-1]|uniref:hypothetical protein n=1 Tax=Salarchaeum sp. JOR-1 TaxID=2599399 RepID=UPI0011989282|nr:hypothetical protein [Salarchaeum sp. JOR-1]QDX39512.1 hypothetical protein FQU85_00890 [Salarchaeum sp. JOR-1]
MTDRPDIEEAVKERLSEDPSEEFIDEIASRVVDEMDESFSELGVKTRALEEIVDDFRNQKLEEVDSEGQYERKIDYIQTYLTEEVQGETSDEFTSEDVGRYKNWRKYDSLDREEPLSNNTLQDDMYLFREFISYMVEHRLAPYRFLRSVEIPELDDPKEGVDEKLLEPERANAILEYLRKYHYADVEHAAMELFCESGPRKGDVYSCDVDSYDEAASTIRYQNQEGTNLKNDEESSREITLYGIVPEIISDYIENRRPDEVDEEGREPLLTKGDGRIEKSTLQKIAYKWTRPCAIGLECPHDRDPEDCEAAQRNNSAYKCPSSRAPHHIRTGYITAKRNAGVSPEAIEQRCDVTPQCQEEHYDLPDLEEERERYEDEFEDTSVDEDSGFSH